MRIWSPVISLLFVSFFVVGIAFAGSESYIETSGYVGGGGGILSKHTSESTTGNGVDSNYNSIIVGSRVMTGPGNSQYVESTILDASSINTVDTQSKLVGDGGVIYDDTSSMTDVKIAIPELEGSGVGYNATQPGQTPARQTVNTHTDGMGDYVTYTSDKVIEGANSTTDYLAEGGSGAFDSKFDAVVEAGASKTSEETDDYYAHVTDRKLAYGNATSTLSGKLSVKYRDFSRPLGFGDVNATPVSINSETGAAIGNTI